MTVTGDPFRQTPVDPPIPLNGRTGFPHVPPATTWPSVYEGQNPYPPIQRPHNTLAVLSAAFAVVLPPVGAVLGHWALAQTRRTGEAGRTAAIWGLILGYSLTAALIAGLILWAEQLTASAIMQAAEVITPDRVGSVTVDAVRRGRFLVLPHPKVQDLYRQKSLDHDRWIDAMRRYQAALAQQVNRATL